MMSESTKLKTQLERFLEEKLFQISKPEAAKVDFVVLVDWIKDAARHKRSFYVTSGDTYVALITGTHKSVLDDQKPYRWADLVIISRGTAWYTRFAGEQELTEFQCRMKYKKLGGDRNVSSSRKTKK